MKKFYTPLFLLFLTTATILSSCKEDTIDGTLVQGYEYFPTDQGRYNQFAVDSIQWDDFDPLDPVDTFTFDIREVNDSILLDNSGDSTVRLERLRRDSANGSWYIKDIWSMKQTDATAEKVEENERFIKLRFPLKDGKVWNGNYYNTIGNWDYEITDLGKPFTVNGVTFPETVTVIQTGSNDPLINKQQGKEVYAKGVGLIYRELMITEAYTDPQFLNLPYDQRIRVGFKLTMKLTDYNPQ
jgi:hypothetical protein